MNHDRKVIPLILFAVLISGCTSIAVDKVPEERETQAEYLLNQFNCLDKSISIENYDSERASVRNTGETTISEVQLTWELEDGETANRVANNLEPGEVRTLSSGLIGDVDSFDASIINCIGK